ADGKALDRYVLRHGEHQRWTGGNLAAFKLAGSDNGDTVDIRSPRLERQGDPLLIVVAELFGARLAKLVARQQPAELQVDQRLRLGIGANTQASVRPHRKATGGKLQDVAALHVHAGLPDHSTAQLDELLAQLSRLACVGCAGDARPRASAAGKLTST